MVPDGAWNVHFDVLTLFPGLFASMTSEGLLGKAFVDGRVSLRLHDFREFATNRHRQVDDRPFGGGPGMVLAAPPIIDCVESVLRTKSGGQTSFLDLGLEPLATESDTTEQNATEQEADAKTEIILLTPSGERLTQPLVELFATRDRVILVCGRYEGFDQRITDVLRPREVSIGDYILNGGEVAAMVIIEAIVRLLDGVIGDPQSHADDSFSQGNRLLEAPQYTRPRHYRGLDVPEILFSGNHAAIADWRRTQSLARTTERRPDLLSDFRVDQNSTNSADRTCDK